MANTPSAKKAARKIARQTAVNKVPRTRMRSFIRKVEEAIASGDKESGARGAAGGAAADHEGGLQGHRAPQHRVAKGVAPGASGRGARLRVYGSARSARRSSAAAFCVSASVNKTLIA